MRRKPSVRKVRILDFKIVPVFSPHALSTRCLRTGHECVDQIPPMFGGPVRKSSEWSGLPGSGKKYKRSLGGEGDMMGPEAMYMMMGRMSKDDLEMCAHHPPPLFVRCSLAL